MTLLNENHFISLELISLAALLAISNQKCDYTRKKCLCFHLFSTKNCHIGRYMPNSCIAHL